MTIGLTWRRTARRIKRLKDGGLTISPDYSDLPTPDFLTLSILYGSFIHPLTILSGLPSAGVGALVTLMLFREDLSVYGFVGILMLIGIVKKNAIMMIDFANQKIFEALGVTPIVERIIRNRHLVPSETEIYPNFESLIYQDVILLQTPRQVIERDPAMCRLLSVIAARVSYGNRLFYLDEDLAKALLRTDPPPDLQFHDLKVAIPSFLVVLPRSWIRSGADHVQALEIALLEPGTWKASLGSMIDDLPFHISHPVFGIA